ncbi:hypothetical protein [Micromonospora sp. 15K316]|uniref:hypothetical protein n=1 Tax=Micromonospora sp. 15K316 TaxID=2530376 RepID=UPI001404D931|nr:hypothetical protein [Micromonospora sp. 15K316]
MVVAGENVTVEGNGSSASPYVISADGGIDCAQVRPCLSAGDGIEYDPTTGVISSDGSVDCAQVRPCLSAGDGIDYDPTTGVISADLSSEPGNNITIGPDGGLLVPSTGGTTVAVASSSCITLTGDGSAGSPLLAQPRLDPDPANTLTCGPNGLLAAGGGSGTVDTACGLAGDGSSGDPLRVAVGTWGYPCDVSQAGRVYCDDSGVLRSEPRGRVLYAAAFDNQTIASSLVPATQTVALSRSLNIINPDQCREGLALVNIDVDIDFTLPAGSSAAYGFNTDEMLHIFNTGSSTMVNTHVQTSKTLRVTVPAASTLTEVLDVELNRGVGGARFTRVQWSIRSFLFVL